MYRRIVLIFLSGFFCSCGSHKEATTRQAPQPDVHYQIEHELLSPEKSPWVATEENSSGEVSLHTFVKEWMGTPHRLGGNTKKGIDCSGFVIQAYLQLYQTGFIGRRAEDIFTEVRPVKKEKLVQGDLVFFKIRSRRIDHVGIYLGDGDFAHASSSRGVMVSNLSEEYWERHFFMGGKKVDKGSN